MSSYKHRCILEKWRQPMDIEYLSEFYGSLLNLRLYLEWCWLVRFWRAVLLLSTAMMENWGKSFKSRPHICNDGPVHITRHIVPHPNAHISTDQLHWIFALCSIISYPHVCKDVAILDINLKALPNLFIQCGLVIYYFIGNWILRPVLSVL